MKDDIKRLERLAKAGDVEALSRLHRLADRHNLPIFEGPFIKHLKRYMLRRAEIYASRDLIGQSMHNLSHGLGSFRQNLANDFHREVNRLVHHEHWRETRYYRTEDSEIPADAPAIRHSFRVWLGPTCYELTLQLDC